MNVGPLIVIAFVVGHMIGFLVGYWRGAKMATDLGKKLLEKSMKDLAEYHKSLLNAAFKRRQ